jgi:hypothetical protein
VPWSITFLGGGGVYGEHQAAHPGPEVTGGLGSRPLQHFCDHLLGFSVVEGGRFGGDHPSPWQVDRPAAERLPQLGQSSQLPSQFEEERRRPPGQTERGADLVGGELPIVVSHHHHHQVETEQGIEVDPRQQCAQLGAGGGDLLETVRKKRGWRWPRLGDRFPNKHDNSNS